LATVDPRVLSPYAIIPVRDCGNGAVLRLILVFVDIMLHRRGPQDVPSSRFLLWLMLAASLGVELAVTLSNGGGVLAVAVAVLVTGLDLWFVWALLRVFNREGRFRQTMTALLGADTILSLVQAPFVPFLEIPNPEQPTLTVPMLVTTLVFLWSIDINAFVFSRALERPYLLCVAIVIAYALLIVSLQATLLQPVT
jgi:hypothetical protein